MTNEELAYKLVKMACPHDYGKVHCPACATREIEKVRTDERQRVILAMEEYGRTDMTLSRLGELLDQSPPVLRILIGRASERANQSPTQSRCLPAKGADAKGAPGYTDPKELLAFVRKWIKDNQVRRGESVYQVDSVNEALPEFLIGCAEIVGYHKDHKDDEA